MHYTRDLRSLHKMVKAEVTFSASNTHPNIASARDVYADSPRRLLVVVVRGGAWACWSRASVRACVWRLRGLPGVFRSSPGLAASRPSRSSSPPINTRAATVGAGGRP